MLTSFGLIFLLGLALAALFRKAHLPRIIGMLFLGILLGPYVLDLLDPAILGISGELRQMALVIILIKAGLSLDLQALKKVGRPALLMTFLPATCEIGAFVLLAPALLDLTGSEAALMGTVMGAVSPAVVVPKMVQLMEAGYGTDKSIPQLILAGASLDDVFVIVLFSCFLSMNQGQRFSALAFLDIPLSILLGLTLGAGLGLLTALFFEVCHRRGWTVRNSGKLLVLLSLAFLLLGLEDLLEGYVAFSGLLGVMSMACAFQIRTVEEVSVRLRDKFSKLWLAAELLLFTLVGAAVDLPYTLQAGAGALLMILTGLAFRSAGVLLCLVGTKLGWKERLFCLIAYLPKATVQAAIGGVPLSLGLACGQTVLSVAVMGILLTAPLGAIGMELSYKKLLQRQVLPEKTVR